MKKLLLIVFLLFLNIFSFAQSTMEQKKIDEKIQQAIKYGDSIQSKAILLAREAYRNSKKINYNKGIVKGLIIIAHNHYNLGEYEAVFKYASEAEKYAYKDNDPEQIAEVLQLKGQGYSELGFLKHGISVFKKALHYAKLIVDHDARYYRLGFLNSALAISVEKERLPNDSIIKYLNKSLANYKELSTGFHNREIVISMTYANIGVFYLKEKNEKSAIENIKKAIFLNGSPHGSKHVRSRCLYLLGEIYSTKKKYDSSLYYYKQGLAIAKELRNPYRLEEIHKGISEAYSKIGVVDSSQLYLQKYVTIKDSLTSVEKKSLNTPLKDILEEKDKEISHSKKDILISSITIIIIFVIISIFLVYDSKKSKKNYKRLIEKLKLAKDQQTVLSDNSNVENESTEIITESKKQNSKISPEIENEIIRKLSEFENGDQFTNPELTMPMLSGMLNTNPRYLSAIINKLKNKNYNQYLNELRINFIIDQLYKDKKFREYKISYLANHCGFSSREVFASTFKKETGVTPSYFINQLKKDNQTQKL